MAKKGARKLYVCGQYCFIESDTQGLWHRTDRCVAFAPCPYCLAVTGQMCLRYENIETTATHAQRRRLYTSTLVEGGEDRNANVVVVTIEDKR